MIWEIADGRAVSIVVMELLAVVAGCRTLPEANLTPDGESLKVLTYNVDVHGDMKGVTAFLNEAKGDIVLLQEIDKQWQAYLDAHLVPAYPYVFFHHYPKEGGMAILSRYPLPGPEVFQSAAGWLPAIYVKVSTPVGEIGILNVHLKPPVSEHSRVTLGSLLTTPGIHRKEINAHLARVDPNLPMIIAGDFNEDESGKACKRLKELGCVDVLSMYDRHSPTWSYPNLIWTLRDRYDHIFIEPPMACTGAAVFKVKASDHEPVVAAVQMNDVE
ncbi:MAG: endonuclease/exonuclease/phosphatase family protein [Planctomycetaceae bacterium]|nr:endonuclease/exonuclease/phosphatase family protein [Planctomycetaceae bacterium]